MINKKSILVLIIFIISILLVGCNLPEEQENSHKINRYYKTIDVKVVENNTETWFAIRRYYKQEITVKSEEYNLIKTFDFLESGMFADLEYYDTEIGSVLKAKMYSWKDEVTGKVIRREISNLK